MAQAARYSGWLANRRSTLCRTVHPVTDRVRHAFLTHGPTARSVATMGTGDVCALWCWHVAPSARTADVGPQWTSTTSSRWPRAGPTTAATSRHIAIAAIPRRPRGVTGHSAVKGRTSDADLRADPGRLPRRAADESVQCCVTSPPYWGLRDYGVKGQFGLEKTPDEYVARMVQVFREVKRVLRKDGTLWLNLGDSYAQSEVRHRNGSNGTLAGGPETAWNAGTAQTGKRLSHGLKPKELVGIPWRVAFALQADGWWLRSDIIWHKPNPMPESVTDRPTKSHEYLFLMTKSERYVYDAEAISEEAITPLRAREKGNGESAVDTKLRGHGSHCGTYEGGRNRRTVWTVATKPYKGAHFACFPPKLIEPCILAGCPEGGTVLDPFAGAGTTGMVALRHGRNFVGVELNPAYLDMARHRIEEARASTQPLQAGTKR